MIEGARAGRAEERLQFGEREFDRIEVWTVGRQKAEVRAGVLNRRPHLGLFVGGEIVEDDDIPRSERRHQDLLDIGAEREGIDGAVKHGRRRQLRRAERRDHRVGLPVAAGCVIRDARASRTAGIAAKQVRGDTRFIDEDILAGIVKWEPIPPTTTSGGDIRTPLFVGVYGFF